MALIDEIQAAQDRLTEAVCTGDAHRAAALYTDDARLIPQGAPTCNDRGAIAAFFSGTFENGIVDLRFDQYGARLQAALSGDKLDGKYDRGTRGAPYAFKATRATTSARPSTEKVPAISGEWRIPTKSSKGESAWRFIVRQNGAAVSATILRIDGDTGTLSGRFANGKLLLSHFSGARPVKYI